MRFLADMGVAYRVVEWLRSQGHDVRHLRDQDLQRLPDRAVFEKAASEGRTILTFDLDFGEILASAGPPGAPSVVVFRVRNTRTSHIIERLRTVLEQSLQEIQAGAIVIVEESRHRIRRLPFGTSPTP